MGPDGLGFVRREPRRVSLQNVSVPAQSCSFSFLQIVLPGLQQRAVDD